ncbi:MAG: hypothetical protein J0I98_18715 [Mesorhizobium sp.]|nr:hypothetical protein [Mesorhizobium sp.]MBN9244821.1 hypothetical protein [Mesorhizobium sp.]
MGSFPLDDLPGPVAVVCHDAGTANILLWGLREASVPFRLYAAGPARRIAEQLALPVWEEDLDSALNGAGSLVSGTGWASSVEHDARAKARALGLPSIAVLDHWANYQERFERQGQQVLPDRYWVTDEIALERARRIFGADAATELVPNLYLARQLSMIRPIDAATPNVLLYVLEPARSDWGRGIDGEFQALDFFLDRFPKLALPNDLVIRLRPHPSDAPGKYAAWMDRNSGFLIELDTAPDMAAALSDVRYVVGCESYGLVVALNAGRKVYCSLPPHAPACRLPHDGIVHLGSMMQTP